MQHAETLTLVHIRAVSCHEPHRIATWARHVRQVTDSNVILLFSGRSPQRALQYKPQRSGRQVLQFVHHQLIQPRRKR